MNKLEEKYPRIKNFNVATKEVNNKVIFLRKLVRGGCEHSFGIHVAKMAGMPQQIIQRANEIIKELEHRNIDENIKEGIAQLDAKSGMQLNMFDLGDKDLMKVRDELNAININAITPVEALMKLNELVKLINK